jgi:carotenoid cleavage dioxygenase-like enzyme
MNEAKPWFVWHGLCLWVRGRNEVLLMVATGWRSFFV